MISMWIGLKIGQLTSVMYIWYINLTHSNLNVKEEMFDSTY